MPKIQHSSIISFFFKRKYGRKYRTIIVVRTIQIVPIEIVTIRTDFLMEIVNMDSESGLDTFFTKHFFTSELIKKDSH